MSEKAIQGREAEEEEEEEEEDDEENESDGTISGPSSIEEPLAFINGGKRGKNGKWQKRLVTSRPNTRQPRADNGRREERPPSAPTVEAHMPNPTARSP